MKHSCMHHASSITVHCSNFSNNSYEWAACLSETSIRMMKTEVEDENEEKWSMLFIKFLIKKSIKKSIDISINSIFILSRSEITNAFTHFFFTKLDEKLRLMMLQSLNLTSRLILKLTCVRLWNFVDDHFNRSREAREGEYLLRSALLNVRQTEHWNIFATQNLLDCFKCHVLRDSSKFDDKQIAAELNNRLCMRDRGHDSWTEINKIIIKNQHFEDSHCFTFLLETYDSKHHDVVRSIFDWKRELFALSLRSDRILIVAFFSSLSSSSHHRFALSTFTMNMTVQELRKIFTTLNSSVELPDSNT